MIIYNTTFFTTPGLAEDVLAWIRGDYLPAAAAEQAYVTRILDNPEPDTCSYAVHMHFADADSAAAWKCGDGARLLAEMHERWGENTLAFSTMLEII